MTAARTHDDRARRIADASRDLQAGFAHHQAGRHDRAEALYRKVLQKVPDHVDALHVLGVIAHQRGRHEHAVQLISRALAGLPGFADGQMNLGNALRAMGRLAEASASYRTAIALKPDLAVARCNLSTLLNMQGAYEEAVENATRAIELMPALVDALVNLGIGLAGQRRFDEAETALRRALALQPDRAQTLSDLGRVLTELTRYDEAVACHRQATALRPDNAMMHFLLATATVYAGDPHDGEAICRHALSLDPKLAIAWTGLGQILRALGRFEEGQACLRHELELDPTLPYADTGLAYTGHQADDEGQLERLHAQLVKPDLPMGIRIDAGFALGKLLDNADRFDEAFPIFATASRFYRQQLIGAGHQFDLAALRRPVDGLIAQCTPALYAAVEGGGNPSQAPGRHGSSTSHRTISSILASLAFCSRRAHHLLPPRSARYHPVMLLPQVRRRDFVGLRPGRLWTPGTGNRAVGGALAARAAAADADDRLRSDGR